MTSQNEEYNRDREVADLNDELVALQLCRKPFYFRGMKRADDSLDRKQATDFILTGCMGSQYNTAVRVRSAEKYLNKKPNYRWEFTCRVMKGSRAITEEEKILSGFGDLMFYGFFTKTEIVHWWLINLAVFRAAVAAKGVDAFATSYPNSDTAETSFRAFDVRKFRPAGFSDIVFCAHPRVAQQAINEMGDGGAFIMGQWP